MLPIVFQALPKWDGNYNSTALTISKMLSEDRRVFYVEHPFSYVDGFKSDRKDQYIRRSKEPYEFPFKDHPNFVVIHPPYTLPLNSLPNGRMYSFLQKRYIKKLWKKIDQVLESFRIEEFGYINSFDPIYFEFESKLNCAFKIYHSVDLITGEPYIAKHGSYAEMEASKKADRVITTSEPLCNRLKAFNFGTQCIPNAVDFDHFSKFYPEPFEFKSRNRKRIVYTGNIGLRIDYLVLEKIAKAHPDVDLWIVGPKDPTYFKGKNLEKIDNVYFTGSRSFAELPAYIHHADVCIIPFECTELTHHIYPLKLNEYLAAGKPIVSSAFTDFGDFKELMHVYHSSDEAVEMISFSLIQPREDLKAKRIKMASMNTWNHRMKAWNKVLEELEYQISSIDKLVHRN